MLDVGIIHPSVSPYSSPILLVCVLTLGLSIKSPSRISFPSLSLMNCYMNYMVSNIFPNWIFDLGIIKSISMKNTSPKFLSTYPKISFHTYEGHYEFLVMLYNLTNSPSTFQSLVNQVFYPYPQKFILFLFDYIFIYNKTWEDHLS